MDPRVSILLPTYEPDPAHLREAIEGLLAQTEQQWTLFIHDDASTVNVKAMVEPYLSDPRITFAHSSKRLGIGGNWNACRTKALASEAAFVQYLFQDDLWEPTYLEQALEVFATHPHVGIVSVAHAYHCEPHDIRAVYDHVTTERAKLPHESQNGKDFLLRWLLQGLHPNLIGEPSFVMLRRAVMERAGPFLEDMPQSLDSEFWVRALRITDWCMIHEKLGTFRVHAKGASEQNRIGGIGLFDRLRCLDIALQSLPRGNERKAATKALIDQIAGMVAKFRHRKNGGAKVHGSGGTRTLLAFGLRHPVVMVLGVLRGIRQTSS